MTRSPGYNFQPDSSGFPPKVAVSHAPLGRGGQIENLSKGVLTSFSGWLKLLKPVETGWTMLNRFHALKRVANSRFAESLLKQAGKQNRIS